MIHSIYLYLRSDVDWRSLDESTFLRQEALNKSVRPMSLEVKMRLYEAIQIWNQTFAMSYFEYRQRLREIAWDTWLKIEGLDGIIRNRHGAIGSCLPSGTILLPVDEDDWFSPQAANTLKAAFSEEIDIYSWNDAAFRPVAMQNYPDHSLPLLRLRNRVQEGEYATNGYAVHLLDQKVINTAWHNDLLMHHTAVKGIVDTRQLVSRHLADTLSLEHKSLASCSNMRWIYSVEDLIRNRSDLVRPVSIVPTPLSWAEAPLQDTCKLNRELMASLRIDASSAKDSGVEVRK